MIAKESTTNSDKLDVILSSTMGFGMGMLEKFGLGYPLLTSISAVTTYFQKDPKSIFNFNRNVPFEIRKDLGLGYSAGVALNYLPEVYVFSKQILDEIIR